MKIVDKIRANYTSTTAQCLECGKLLSGWGSGFNIWERRVHNNKAGGKIRFKNKI